MFKILVLVFFTHWIADFVMQSRKIAENKSHNFGIMLQHIGIYSVVLFVVLMWIDIPFAFRMAFVNGIFHFIIDVISSQYTTKFYKEEKIHEFWVVIGLDQFSHSGILIWTTITFYQGGYLI